MIVAAFLAIGRADEDDGIDVFLQHELEVLLLAAELDARAAENHIEAALTQVMLDEGYGLGVEGIGDVGAEDADHFHGVQAEAAGEGVRGIVLLLDGLQDFLPGFLADFIAAVDDA